MLVNGAQYDTSSDCETVYLECLKYISVAYVEIVDKCEQLETGMSRTRGQIIYIQSVSYIGYYLWYVHQHQLTSNEIGMYVVDDTSNQHIDLCTRLYCTVDFRHSRPFCTNHGYSSNYKCWLDHIFQCFRLAASNIASYWPHYIGNYRKTSSISRTKFQNLNVSRLVLQLSLLNPLNPAAKLRMKM